jgi:pimeloyl-ACP methyl ester carboxylesterase
MQKFITIDSYINFMPMQFIPAHKISYLEFGSQNEQAIICAHGLTRNAHDFDKIAKALSERYRVISIDYPGRGNSDYFENKNHYNYAVYVKDTIRILESLNIKQPIWLGTSMGGIIGMIMAAKFPNLFKGLILNDIGPSMPVSTVNKISNYARQRPYFNNLSDAKTHLQLIYSPFGIKSEEDWDDMTRHSFVKNENNQYQMNYDPEIVRGVNSTIPKKKQNIEIWHLWNKIRCPVLVIHGEKSNILLPETIEQMQKTKQFDLHNLKDVGHAPALVGEEEIELIKEWTERTNAKNKS